MVEFAAASSIKNKFFNSGIVGYRFPAQQPIHSTPFNSPINQINFKENKSIGGVACLLFMKEQNDQGRLN